MAGSHNQNHGLPYNTLQVSSVGLGIPCLLISQFEVSVVHNLLAKIHTLVVLGVC